MAPRRTRLGNATRTMSFEEATAERDRIERELAEAEAALAVFPRRPDGLTPDHIRALPEWRAAKSRSARAFARLQAFNAVFVKVYAKELREQRAARRGTR